MDIAHNLAILSLAIATDTVSAILRKFFSNINPIIDTLSNMIVGYRLVFPIEEEGNWISLDSVFAINIKRYFSLLSREADRETVMYSSPRMFIAGLYVDGSHKSSLNSYGI